MKRAGFGILIAILTFSLGSSVAIGRAVPSPMIIGPIPWAAQPGDPSHEYTYFSSPWLDDFDYVEEEYFIDGFGNVYDTPPLQTGTIISSGHPFRTRLVVRRPRQAARFNGTVILEWLNVTGGFDFEALWLSGSAAGLMRAGYTWVGVSVQAVGIHAPVNGLRDWSPVRYGTLDVTDGGTLLAGELSYDIFSQAGQAVMQPVGPGVLGGQQPLRLIGAGASQSAFFLGRYYNAIQPLANRFDGFLLTGDNAALRQDLGIPAIKLHSETDAAFVAFGAPFPFPPAPPLQPDSNILRTWQVAGTSHLDRFVYDNGAALSNRDSIPIVVPLGVCARPELSRVPFFHVLTAAFGHLGRWIDTGTPPPTAPLIETDDTAIVRDALGLARGGIQLAAVAAPTATNTGENSGPPAFFFCPLLGSHEPFTPDTLGALYPFHGAYLSAVEAATRANLEAGFLTRQDAQDTITRAAQAAIGR